jgi:hypothetical protein
MVMGTTGRRSGSAYDQVPCPEAAYVYNQYKDGIDQFDKACLGHSYSVEMEVVSRKWWIRVWLGLLDSAFVNAHILFKEAHANVSRFDFMVTLQTQLVENTQDNMRTSRLVAALSFIVFSPLSFLSILAFCNFYNPSGLLHFFLLLLCRSRARGGRLDTVSNKDSGNKKHRPVKNEANRRKRCKLCALKCRGGKGGSNCTTRWSCKVCKVPLKWPECFNEWHNTERLKGRDFGKKRLRVQDTLWDSE